MSDESIRLLISEASNLIRSDSSTTVYSESLDECFKQMNKDADKLSELRFHSYIVEHELQSRANRVIEKSDANHERTSHSVRHKQTKWLEEQSSLLEHEIYKLSDQISCNERRRYSRDKAAIRTKQLTRFLVMKRELEHLVEANDRLKISKPRTPISMPKNERDTLLYNFERLQKSLVGAEKVVERERRVECEHWRTETVNRRVHRHSGFVHRFECFSTTNRSFVSEFADSSFSSTSFSSFAALVEISMDSKEVEFTSMEVFEICPWCWKLEPNQHCVQERDDSNEPTGQIVMLPEPVVAHSFGMSVYVKQINGIWSVRIFDHETGDHYVIPQIFLTIPSMYRGFVFSYQEMDFSFNHYYNSIFKFPLIQRSDKFFNRKFQANYQQSKVWKEDETTTEVPTSTPESDICVPRWQLEDKTCRPYPRKLQKETPKSLLSDDTFVGTVGGCIIFVEIVIGVAAILYVWRKCPPKPKPLRPKDISITYLSDNEGV
ncbi:hypothetical protein M3Y94_00640100 [Aphelenchoides besseyi]|nr:hypothetical protein M3Y94_00640100 [Aphelenchoides besseyi]